MTETNIPMPTFSDILGKARESLESLEEGKDYNGKDRLLIDDVSDCMRALKDIYNHLPQLDDRYKPILNMPKIGLDIDEVLCNFLGGWKDRWSIANMPTSWFFDRQILQRFEEMRQSGELDEFYLSLIPLIKPTDIPFEPHCYITSRPVSSEVSAEWLDMNGFPQRPVYTTDPDNGITKVSLCKEHEVEAFVDDRFENWRDLNNAGITCYLYTQPHNERYDVGHLRINSLKELVR